MHKCFGNVNEWVYDIYRPLTYADVEDLNPLRQSEELDPEGLYNAKVLGIEDVTSQIFNVYPIPAQRKLKVVLKDNVEVERIEFIDYSGKAITPKSSKRKENTLTLDVSNLYSGIYILNLVTEKGTSKARVIIER